MSTRTTQLGAEAVEVVRNNARTTEIGVEFVYAITHNSALVTQVGAEFVHGVSNSAFVTELGAEFAYKRAGSCTVTVTRPASITDAFVPVTLLASETFIVPTNRQALFKKPITVLGRMILRGDLLEVS